MFEMKCRKYNEAELNEIAQLIYKAYINDEALAAAFPEDNTRLEHIKQALSYCSANGEIHTVREDGCFTAAALWSLPYQKPPYPNFGFNYTEPCCKLYMIASVKPAMGSALMHFALFRYEAPPLLLVCTTPEQETFFKGFGFTPVLKTDRGTVMLNDRKTIVKKDC
jgi:hypothetical protein